MKPIRAISGIALAVLAVAATMSACSGTECCKTACKHEAVIAHWKFDAAPGPVLADETGKYPATVAGTVTQDSAGSWRFPGDTTAAWAAHDSTLDLAGGFTIEAMIEPTRLGNPNNGLGVQAIAEKHVAPGGYLLVLTPTGHLSYWLETAEGQTRDTSTVAVLPGTGPHHVAMTWDMSTVRFYVDGKPAGEGPFAGPLGRCSQPLFLGNDNTLNWGFAGVIHDIRVSSVALLPGAFCLPANCVPADGPPEKCEHSDSE